MYVRALELVQGSCCKEMASGNSINLNFATETTITYLSGKNTLIKIKQSKRDLVSHVLYTNLQIFAGIENTTSALVCY